MTEVRLRRTGGIAGMTLDSGPVELGPEHEPVLRALLEEPAPRRRGAGPDRFGYELTVGERRVRLREDQLTPAVRALIAELERCARRRRPGNVE